MIPESNHGTSEPVLVRSATVCAGAPATVTISVQVEAETSSVPSFRVLGAPGHILEGEECRTRIRSALRASGLPFPQAPTTVRVSGTYEPRVPADFDLAIAIGLLVAQGILSRKDVADVVLIGELSLGGEVWHVRGVLPIAVAAARETPRPVLVVPAADLAEAAVIGCARAVGVESLQDALRVLLGPPYVPGDESGEVDLAEIAGEVSAKRVLEIAAAGGHHTLLVGPPGTGKTMLGRRVPGLLPRLSREEAVVVTALHSIAGLGDRGEGLLTHRPFRAPHHTVSHLAMLGGGKRPRPGEISLAHHGVLFLDEIAEFDRRVLEALGPTLTAGHVRFGYPREQMYPANALCVAAVNPCPCGHRGDASLVCRCSERQVQSYLQPVAGLMKHFDLRIGLSLSSASPRGETPHAGRESSAIVRARVKAAWERQRTYWPEGLRDTNARLSRERLLRFCTDEAISTLTADRTDVESETRVLRVARTIADLDKRDRIVPSDLNEAMDYQRLP